MELNNLTLETKTLYETIADKMELMILNDRTQLEQKLPSEQFLAEAFGVSRPVIREAIKLLKERGLIKSRQGAASVITKPGVETLTKNMSRITLSESISPMEIYQIRIVLETFGASLAAQNTSPETVARMRQLNDQLLEHMDDPVKTAQTDMTLHREIWAASKNTLLEMMLSSISVILRPLLEKTVTSRELILDGNQFHRQIIDAIAQGDAKTASDLMHAHLILSARNYEYFESIQLHGED